MCLKQYVLLKTIKTGVFLSSGGLKGFSRSSGGKESTCNAGNLSLIHGQGSSTGEGMGYPFQYSWTFLAQLVKNPSAMKQMGKQWKQCQTLFWGAPKSLQMVTAAMKLKDAYSLEEKL